MKELVKKIREKIGSLGSGLDDYYGGLIDGEVEAYEQVLEWINEMYNPLEKYECENDGYVVKDSEGRYVKESFISIAYGIVSKCKYEYTLDPRSADVFLDESMAQIMAKLLPDKAEVLALKELREDSYYEV